MMKNPGLIGLLAAFALFNTLLAAFSILGLEVAEALFLTLILCSLIGQIAFYWLLIQKKGGA